MQLSRKTWQTTLSSIKLKVTPLDHPFKKTKWFWQNIIFQNSPMKIPASIGHENSKRVSTTFEYVNHLQQRIVGTVT